MQHWSTRTVSLLEGVNLFCGDHNPTQSNHLTLDTLKLPDITLHMIDYAPGGSPVEIEVPVSVTKLRASFSLIGAAPPIMAQVLSGRQVFTAYGLLRDKMTGRARQAKAIMEGYTSAVSPQAYQKGKGLFGIDYEIGGMLHYDLSVAGQRIYFWDHLTQTGFAGDYGQSMAEGVFGFSLRDHV